MEVFAGFPAAKDVVAERFSQIASMMLRISKMESPVMLNECEGRGMEKKRR